MNRQLVRILHALAWLLIFVAGFSVYTQFVDADTALGRTFVNIGFLGALFYLNIYLIGKFYEQQQKRKYYLFSSFLVIGVIAIRVVFNSWFASLSEGEIIPEKPVIYVSVTLLTTMIIYIMSSLLAIVQNRNKAEKRHLEQLNQLQLSQLKFLKAQINPHFLFNSLNNIYALVLTKSDKAPEMLIKLSELLRYAIYQGKSPRVKLANEVDQMQRYIELFQLKSKTQLPIQLTISLNDLNCSVPPMILVTLVENAFKHGDLGESSEAVCKFNLTTEREKLTFETTNTFNPTKEKDETGGIGLKNLEETLTILYPGKFALNHRTEKTIFKVSLCIFYGS